MLNFELTPQNLRQQIAQIDFITRHPLHPVARIFLDYWNVRDLLAKKAEYLRMLKNPVKA